LSKKIVIILRKPPHGSLYPAEGLRVAVAVSASDTKVVSIEDSTYAFLKGADMTLYKHHLDFLEEAEIPVLIDEESLDKRRLDKEDLIDDAMIEKHSEIMHIIASADATLTF
jgi:sulfur relay (sulfurtransferase) DsrF/TusC family protein